MRGERADGSEVWRDGGVATINWGRRVLEAAWSVSRCWMLAGRWMVRV